MTAHSSQRCQLDLFEGLGKNSHSLKTEEERHDSERADEILMDFIHRWEDALKRADDHASVVEIPGAHHYMFLNEQGVVLEHIQSFLEKLPK